MSNSTQFESVQMCAVCNQPNPTSSLKCSRCGLPLITPDSTPAKPVKPSEPVVPRPLADLSGGTVSLFVQGRSQPVIIHPDHPVFLGVREYPDDAAVSIDFKTAGGQYLGVEHQHAILQLLGDYVHIEDLGSRRGTFVNNQRLNPGEPYRLRNGDQIRLGDLLIVFMYYGDSRSARLI